MRPPDLERLKDDLVNFRAELEEAGGREELIRTGLPRMLATLEMIPDERRDGDVLELGASPYFLSLALHRLCGGRLRHGNYFGTEERHGATALVHQRTGEQIVFEYDQFNIESDDFPYPEASFDVVIFSELIEHLGLNPVRTLSEIHRILKPDGCVIVTTPNALSLERLATFARGGSQMVDRYSPLFGYGARHNREYHPGELRTLLEGCGFVIEVMDVRDLTPVPRGERWQRAVWQQLLRLYSDVPRAEHIFLRARRGARFRWTFPTALFDNIEYYTLVRHPWMEMGINDSIQCAADWHPLESRPAGGEMRWTAGRAQAFLKTPPNAEKVTLDIFAAAAPGAPPAEVHFAVWDRWIGRIDPIGRYIEATATLERGRWHHLEFPLSTPRPRAGDELVLWIKLADPAAAAHPALAHLPERERGLAVHRIEMV